MRGKFASEGVYRWTTPDREDGYDAVEWLATRPWSTGRVGTYGCSYRGENQVQLLAARHPAHAAAIIKAGSATWRGGERYRNWATNNGGAFELAMIFSWFRENGATVSPGFRRHPDGEAVARASRYYDLEPRLPELDLPAFWYQLPVSALMERAGAPPLYPSWPDLVSHPAASDWWERFGWVTAEDRFGAPVLWVDSWYDYGVAETLRLRELVRANATTPAARENQRAIIAPTTHCDYEAAEKPTVVGGRVVGDATLDYYDRYVAWFDRWLRGEANGVETLPATRYFRMGGGGAWKTTDVWPPAGTDTVAFHLDSGGRANSRFGDGVLVRESVGAGPGPGGGAELDAFVYDPGSPVPTVGGQACCTGSPQVEGGVDQSTVETRSDVLVYTSPPLGEGLDVTGFLEAVIYLSSTAPDTDVTVKLVDVHPDGRAFNVQEGIQRVRYREGLDREVFLEEGEVVEVRVNLHATSNFFPAGHRIRVEVSSSNFPRFDRNLNTGGDNRTETEWQVAANRVHHAEHYPSRILLPVVGSGGGRVGGGR